MAFERGTSFPTDAPDRKKRPTSSPPPWLRILARPSLGFAALVVGTSFVMYRLESGGERALAELHVKTSLRIARGSLEADLANVGSDVLTMARLASTQEAVDSDTPPRRRRLARDLIAFARQRPGFDEIRLLGPDGRERVHIRLGTEGAYVVADAYLEDLGRRPYFRPAMARAPGDLHVSSLELSLVNGQVEQPLKPFLRFATPLVTQDGRKGGLLIVNYAAGGWLDRLRKDSEPGSERLFLLDEEGHYVLARDPGLEWSGLLPGRRAQAFARIHPEAWAVVSAEEAGYTRVGRRVFAFETVHALAAGAGPRWKLVSEASPRSSAGARRWVAYAAAALILLAAVAVGDRLVTWARAARRELALQAREQLRVFQVIADSVPAPLFYRDAEGRFLGSNAALADLIGWPRGSLEGRTLDEVMRPPDAERARRFDRLVLESDAGHRYEAEILDLDGRRRQYLVSRSPVRDEDGRATGVSGVMMDVTDLKRAEAEASAARDAALAAGRAKTEFLATMSHEIRTPLSAVIGMTGLLLETPLDADQREYAQAARSSGEALLTVLGDILDFSKIEAGKLEFEEVEIDPRALLDDTLALLAQGAHAKGLELTGLVEAEVPRRVVGDPGRLRQVLLNLLSNAVKFTTAGEVSAALRAGAREGGRFLLRLEVRDTGPGIDPARLERLFDAFTQADNSTTRRYGGTGLGLAISRRLVEAMGGRIEVESEVGRGSVFRCGVWLGVGEAAGSVPDPAPLHGRRVLVLDDSAASRAGLAEMLSGCGVVVEEAAGPGQAAAALESGRALPDVVFVDAHPDGEDGIAFLRALRSQPGLGHLPVAVLVGLGSTVIAREARAAGATAVLAKPIRRDQLFESLMSILDPARAQGANRPTPAGRAELSRRRVLVVEDNPVNQRVAAAQLARLGCEVDVAGNGLEALAALSRQAYHLVFMDCQMPEMDGFTASRTFRTREGRGRRTPIVAMTANALKGDREACLAAGMDDYVAKPARPEDLALLLERWAGDAKEAAASAPAFDPAVLQTLRDLEAAAEPGIFQEVLQTFRETASAKVAAVQEAVRAADREALQRAAHSLKGSCGMVGAQAMFERCGALETAARAGATELGAEVEALVREWERARPELDQTIAEPASAPTLQGAA
jgi:PAS domain S-box-containing protein